MTYYASQSVVFGLDWINTVLAAYKVAPLAALTDLAKLRLSKDPSFNPTPASTITDLEANEADYSGYAAGGVAVVLSAPVLLSTVCSGVLFPYTFLATSASPFVPATVYGWWMDDGTNFIAGERFANSQNAGFAAPGAFLALTTVLPFQTRQSTT